ncbi:GTP cyclohydrolase II [Allopusillimonas ginsengisoli]|uniref:GTP cyclohydrolase II n=1 Tax=Allopusillimonas ginsengisoli TaxID=453575 RepID=UPI00102144CB|nr:GTP cyclohydrolase II [Allopusillimonas ginsengisoli]TEA78078.1 GTP cyclohydrolase II [Allopusillimonas ginsengisoli]
MPPITGEESDLINHQQAAAVGDRVAGYTLDYIASSNLPTPWATFQIHIFVDPATAKEHLLLSLGDVADGKPVLARVHSECLTGDALFSQRCDCGAQLEAAMQAIASEGRGALLYLRQEGRGIGLVNKIRAYRLQDEGADTVEANVRLGFPADMRRYDLCKPMLDHCGITSLRLMTNNPRKVAAMEKLGITVAERLPLQVNRNPYNEHYLSTKASKLGHWLKDKR